MAIFVGKNELGGWAGWGWFGRIRGVFVFGDAFFGWRGMGTVEWRRVGPNRLSISAEGGDAAAGV